MRSIIFHLSDMHIDAEVDDKIIKYFIDNFDFSTYSKAFFVFSGDLAFSGKNEQYFYFYSFLENENVKLKM